MAELRFGLELLSGTHKERASAMLRRLRRKPQLRITTETAATFGRLAAELRRAGRDPAVRVNDLWLAAQAVQRNFHLLTANGKDFIDIPGLKLTILPAVRPSR